MSSQLLRLASFATWPSSAAVSCLELARSGFKYSGHGESTFCMECQLVIDSWPRGDRPDQLHRQRSPNCPFVLRHLQSADSPVSTVAAVERLSHNRDITDRVQSLTVTDGETQRVNCVSNVNVTAGNHLPSLCSVDRTYNPDFERLKDEAVRLSTFHDWPERAASIVEPRDLAKAGMFYTGQIDRVQCAFCHGYLRNWVQGDKPADEHLKHFPDCPFMRQLRDVTDNTTVNVTASSAVSSSAAASSSIDAVDRPRHLSPSRPRPPALSRPKHPNYSSEQRRVESFTGTQVPRGQSVAVLAKAGFFHVGPDDNVRCYFCDGGLKNWQPTDEPWTEHRRWFSRCPHLQMRPSMPEIPPQNLPRNPDTNYIAVRQPSFVPAANRANVEYRIEPREIKARLDAPVVQAVIKMGYSRDVVRKVIEQRLTSTGDDFPSAHSLLEAIFAMEEQPNKRRLTENSQASSAAAAASVTEAVNSTADVNTVSAAVGASVTSMVDKSQQDSAAAVLDVVDETLPPKPKSKRKKKKGNKSSSSSSSAAAAAAAVNGASSTDAATIDVSNSVPTTTMLEENEKLKEERTCKVCMDAEVNTVFLPCGHFVCCTQCAQQLQRCPICRISISGTVRASVS